MANMDLLPDEPTYQPEEIAAIVDEWQPNVEQVPQDDLLLLMHFMTLIAYTSDMAFLKLFPRELQPMVNEQLREHMEAARGIIACTIKAAYGLGAKGHLGEEAAPL